MSFTNYSVGLTPGGYANPSGYYQSWEAFCGMPQDMWMQGTSTGLPVLNDTYSFLAGIDQQVSSLKFGMTATTSGLSGLTGQTGNANTQAYSILSSLGLSDDELAELGIEKPVDPMEQQAYSLLSGMGFSDKQIAELGITVPEQKNDPFVQTLLDLGIPAELLKAFGLNVTKENTSKGFSYKESVTQSEGYSLVGYSMSGQQYGNGLTGENRNNSVEECGYMDIDDDGKFYLNSGLKFAGGVLGVIDDDKNGVQLNELTGAGLPSSIDLSGDGNVTNDEMLAFFYYADKDKDGYIAKEEKEAAISELGSSSSLNKAKLKKGWNEIKDAM